MESLGIANPERSMITDFEECVCFKNGHYEVTLPWKDPHPPLPDNRQLSLKRLQGLIRRLRQQPSVFKEYNRVIQTQIDDGIVEVVADPDQSANGRVHYLPHHPVIRKDKETTKLRIVYDASARSSGPSLNDCLHTGPKFNQRILDILLRFRTYQVALTADIEKDFLMVSMAEDDRDALRFLWTDDVDSDPPTIRDLRFTRVVFGVSSSPFLLNATIDHHLEKYVASHPNLVKTLRRSIYVDDEVTGADTENEAIKPMQLPRAL